MRLFLIKFKTLILAIFLLSVSIISMSQRIDSDHLYFRSYIFGFLFNIEATLLKINTSIVDVFVNHRTISELEQQLEQAELQILYYKEKARLYTHLQQENDHLKKTLQMRTQMRYSAYYSKVLFRDPSLLADYLIIDKGQKNGLRINMPVVSTDENEDERLILIGKIVEVGHDFARVQVVSAKNFYVGVKSLETGYTGILKGQGAWNQNLSLEYIPIEANPLIGEQIITSGESEIYPEGLYVGEINGIGQNAMEEFFKTLYIQSKFEYTKITEVFVLDYINSYPKFNTEIIHDGI